MHNPITQLIDDLRRTNMLLKMIGDEQAAYRYNLNCIDTAIHQEEIDLRFTQSMAMTTRPDVKKDLHIRALDKMKTIEDLKFQRSRIYNEDMEKMWNVRRKILLGDKALIEDALYNFSNGAYPTILPDEELGYTTK